MNMTDHMTAQGVADIRELALRERRMALSDREWSHRLMGYGYRVIKTEAGAVICGFRDDEPLCTLPAEREAEKIH
ncbi:hypothetical protein DRV85_07310 [Rhodosalinus halophilus]|uniref:Uncharacterized protein n=2 Tax=Rhodosalinus halophilus TaxID=2259333 RepID=A0A365U9Y0_9RHOB|nr:hypothetical protein DRV85_07310 [Rhodosalinus halophilus]